MPRFLTWIRLPLSDSVGPTAFSQDSPENTCIVSYDFLKPLFLVKSGSSGTLEGRRVLLLGRFDVCVLTKREAQGLSPWGLLMFRAGWFFGVGGLVGCLAASLAHTH